MEYSIGVFYGMVFYETKYSEQIGQKAKSPNKNGLAKLFVLPLSCWAVVNLGSSYDTHGLGYWSHFSEAIFNTFIKLLLPVAGLFLFIFINEIEVSQSYYQYIFPESQ